MRYAPDATLGGLIEEHGWAGLLAVGEDGREPDLCRFTRGRHLGLNAVWVGPDGHARLVYFTDMERGEAAATGMECLGPAELGLASLRRETASTGEFVGRAVLRLTRELRAAPGGVGLAGRLASGDVVDLVSTLSQRDWLPVSASDVLRTWRRRKDKLEVAAAKRAARATCDVFIAVVDRLREAGSGPITAGDLRRIVAARFAELGLEQPAGNIVAAGAAAAVPHSSGDDTDSIRPGQTLVIDLFPRALVYADCSRTFCLPPIPPSVRDAHAVVRSALEVGSAGVVAGASVSRVVGEALTVIEDAGYPTLRLDRSTRRGMVHSLGHGVGYQLHELPNLRPGSRDRFETGDLITVEPGIYDPNAGWGIRLEDMLLIGEDGRAETLTPLPYDLDPAAWPSRGDACLPLQ